MFWNVSLYFIFTRIMKKHVRIKSEKNEESKFYHNDSWSIFFFF